MELAFFFVTPIVTFFLGVLAMFVGSTRKIGELQIEHSKTLAKAKREEYRAGYNNGVEVGQGMYTISKSLLIHTTLRRRIIKKVREAIYSFDGVLLKFSK